MSNDPLQPTARRRRVASQSHGAATALTATAPDAPERTDLPGAPRSGYKRDPSTASLFRCQPRGAALATAPNQELGRLVIGPWREDTSAYREDKDCRNLREWAEEFEKIAAGRGTLTPWAAKTQAEYYRRMLSERVAKLDRAAGRHRSGNTEETDEHREERKAYHDRRNAWKQLPMERREAQAFQLLGDGRLTIAELYRRFYEELGTDCVVYEGDIRSLVGRMFKAGRLEREGEQWRNKTRYRYLRKRPLEGPIADLQAEFDRPEGEGA